MMVKKKLNLVVLSGAGISAESGVATFRGSGGLWAGRNVQDVASPEGWQRDFRMVLDFYNQRRRKIAEVKPNLAHTTLAELEHEYNVNIITQNIDNLHEQGGSTYVLHLHGEITKGCSSNFKRHVTDIGFKDISEGDVCPDGYQMRPFIVWFGESVPEIESAIEIVSQADILLVIGTSLEVYPAAGLVNYAPENAPIYVIDPSEILQKLQVPNEVIHIQKIATKGVLMLKQKLGRM